MKTFVVYPSVIKRATAYKQLDTGEIGAPCGRTSRKTRATPSGVSLYSTRQRQDRGLKTTQSWSLAGTQLILRC